MSKIRDTDKKAPFAKKKKKIKKSWCHIRIIDSKLVAHCAPVLLFDPPSCSLKNMAPDLAFLTQRKQSTRAPFSILLIFQHKIYNVTWKKTQYRFYVSFNCLFCVCIFSLLQRPADQRKKNVVTCIHPPTLNAFDYTKIQTLFMYI